MTEIYYALQKTADDTKSLRFSFHPNGSWTMFAFADDGKAAKKAGCYTLESLVEFTRSQNPDNLVPV